MSEKWDGFAVAIETAEKLIRVDRVRRHLDGITKESMDAVIREMKFLYLFLGYTSVSSSSSSVAAAAAASPSPNVNINNDNGDDDTMDPLFVDKLNATGKFLRNNLQHGFINRFPDEAQSLAAKLAHLKLKPVNIVYEVRSQIFRYTTGSKRSEIIKTFNLLEKEISDVKPGIEKVYLPQTTSSSSSLFQYPRHQAQPNWSASRTTGWHYFYIFLESILEYLSQQESLDESLRKQMRALQVSFNSHDWILSFGVGDDGDDQKLQNWMNDMITHLGRSLVEVAHLCCFCWYAALSIDQDMQQDLASKLSHLHRRLDPDSPVFLDIAIGFLKNSHEESTHKTSVSSFVHHIVGVVPERKLLHSELVSLLTCFNKILEMPHMMDVHSIILRIKDVVLEARYLRGKDMIVYKVHFVTLLANICFLKYEIFIKSDGFLLPISEENHVKALQEGCTFVAACFIPTDDDDKSVDSQILKLIQGVPNRVQSLYQSSEEDILVRMKVRDLLYKSLVQIMAFKAKTMLLELLEKEAGLMIPLKLKIGTLHDGLFFLIQSDENAIDEKQILIDIEELANHVISLCNTFLAAELTEEDVKNMEVKLLDSLEKLQHLMPKLKGVSLQVPTFHFPRTPRLLFIQQLSQNLGDLCNRKDESIAHATHQIEAISKDLEFIVSTFQGVFKEGIEKQECKHLYTKLAELAYQVEHVIDSMLGENKAVWQHSLWLYQLSEEIRHIKKQLIDFDGYYTDDDGGDQNVLHRLMPVAPIVSTTPTEESMVGLNDQKEHILDQLTRGTKNRAVVSIIGMLGIGKTTLANNVFCCPQVGCHFAVRAWCCVSQKYKKRDLLLGILSHMITITNSTHDKDDAELEDLLRKQLKGKRYLIIMDDMWSRGPWEDLQLIFPDDSYGSRILITTRLQDVVSEISQPYHLQPLSEEESWELLQFKVFKGKECPPELLKPGKQIAKNCQGLPLAIAAIAGVLGRTCGKSEDIWNEIAQSVSSQIASDPKTQCTKILELSYSHLPDHLKACLLYYGAFPEDTEIPLWRLQLLWSAEGFISASDSKSMEDLAEEYLSDLVGRSLVIVSKRGSTGRVKACRVHNVVRDLCLLKCKGDNFVQPISGNDEPYSSFDGLRYGVHYERFDASDSVTYDQYRLSFRVNREQFVVSRPSGPFVRSLMFTPTTDKYPTCPYDISFIYECFERLRVLDLESINMGSFWVEGIELLIALRYLAVCGDMERIPSSFSTLQNLETFILKGLKSNVILPDTIWRIKKLRHIRISNHAIFTLPEAGIEGSFQLDSLITLSLPYFSLGEEMQEILKKFPNLRKLKCIVSEPADASMNSCRVISFDSLFQLESLKISYYGVALHSVELKLPSSLNKLTLSDFHLSLDQISAIGKLTNLLALKLISCSFEDPKLEMEDGEFSELQYLELDNLNIVELDFPSDALPPLLQLVLRNCNQLKELPDNLASISTLQKIEVQSAIISHEESLKEIQELMDGVQIVFKNSQLG